MPIKTQFSKNLGTPSVGPTFYTPQAPQARVGPTTTVGDKKPVLLVGGRSTYSGPVETGKAVSEQMRYAQMERDRARETQTRGVRGAGKTKKLLGVLADTTEGEKGRRKVRSSRVIEPPGAKGRAEYTGEKLGHVKDLEESRKEVEEKRRKDQDRQERKGMLKEIRDEIKREKKITEMQEKIQRQEARATGVKESVTGIGKNISAALGLGEGDISEGMRSVGLGSVSPEAMIEKLGGWLGKKMGPSEKDQKKLRVMEKEQDLLGGRTSSSVETPVEKEESTTGAVKEVKTKSATGGIKEAVTGKAREVTATVAKGAMDWTAGSEGVEGGIGELQKEVKQGFIKVLKKLEPPKARPGEDVVEQDRKSVTEALGDRAKGGAKTPGDEGGIMKTVMDALGLKNVKSALGPVVKMLAAIPVAAVGAGIGLGAVANIAIQTQTQKMKNVSDNVEGQVSHHMTEKQLFHRAIKEGQVENVARIGKKLGYRKQAIDAAVKQAKDNAAKRSEPPGTPEVAGTTSTAPEPGSAAFRKIQADGAREKAVAEGNQKSSVVINNASKGSGKAAVITSVDDVGILMMNSGFVG